MALVFLVTASASALAHPPAPERPAETPFATSFVVDSDFDPVFREILQSSATVRRQYDVIARSPQVRVFVGFTLLMPSDRRAETGFRRSGSGDLEARVEIATPLRIDQYAQMLGHELEHVLEQLEGVNLVERASARSGVFRLADGVYETDRAVRAGREAALEVFDGRQGAAVR